VPSFKPAKEFDRFLVHRRLEPATVRVWMACCDFFSWFETRHKKLSALTLSMSIVTWRRSPKVEPWTMRQDGSTLRILLRYAKMQRWCCGVIPEAIRGPSILRHQSFPAGPSWVDVRASYEPKANHSRLHESEGIAPVICDVWLENERGHGAPHEKQSIGRTRHSLFVVPRNYTVQRFPIFPQFELAVKRYLD